MRIKKLTLIGLVTSITFANSGVCVLSEPANRTDSGVTEHSVGQPTLLVTDIRIEGNRLISKEDIFAKIKTRIGETFDRNRIIEDLKAVGSTGYFEDATLAVFPELKNGGVALKFRVQEFQAVKRFSFQGNLHIGEHELQMMFANQLNKPKNLNHLSNDIDRVELEYRLRCCPDARVVDVVDLHDGCIQISIEERSKNTAFLPTPRTISHHRGRILPAQIMHCEYQTNDLSPKSNSI